MALLFLPAKLIFHRRGAEDAEKEMNNKINFY
jgi:hypothetical protein